MNNILEPLYSHAGTSVFLTSAARSCLGAAMPKQKYRQESENSHLSELGVAHSVHVSLLTHVLSVIQLHQGPYYSIFLRSCLCEHAEPSTRASSIRREDL